MKLKTAETLISIIFLYISLLILYYSGFFKFNIKDDNIYKIIPSIITAFTALYVGYEARKITREQKDIAKRSLDINILEKKYKTLECAKTFIKKVNVTRLYIDAVEEELSLKKYQNNTQQNQEIIDKTSDYFIELNNLYADLSTIHELNQHLYDEIEVNSIKELIDFSLSILYSLKSYKESYQNHRILNNSDEDLPKVRNKIDESINKWYEIYHATRKILER